MSNKKNKRKEKRDALLLFTGLLAVCVLVLAVVVVPQLGGSTVPVSAPPESVLPGATGSEEPEVSSEPEPVVPDPVSIHILGAGDNLIHSTLYKQANARAGGGDDYDFGPVYERIAPLVEAADIAVVNQETILAGDELEVSDYPNFCSPTQVGDELIKIGFDVFSQGNNHVLDKGQKGMDAALRYWDKQKEKGVVTVGLYKDDEDVQDIRIVEREGIKTAHIGVTTMTNGIPMPEGTSNRLIMADDEELIRQLIEKAGNMADVVVVSVHWGNENTNTPTEDQKNLAKKMSDWGADIIFGNHAHTLQPVEYLEREDGSRSVVIYAMGNLASAQADPMNMIHGFLDVTVTKDFATNETEITGVKLIPSVTHYDSGYKNNRLYLLSDYTEELALNHGVHDNYRYFSLEYLQKLVTDTIDAQFLD